jgi:exodeoxyribonuclease VII small subunit
MTKKTNQTTATGFNANYQKLNEIARTLRMQEEPDIDALVPMVQDATEAYTICKQRIEDVKLALKDHFAAEPDS